MPAMTPEQKSEHRRILRAARRERTPKKVRDEARKTRAREIDTVAVLRERRTFPAAVLAMCDEINRLRALQRVGALRGNVREHCRNRKQLDGADAQALEHALTITERERDAAISRIANLRRLLARAHRELSEARDALFLGSIVKMGLHAQLHWHEQRHGTRAEQEADEAAFQSESDRLDTMTPAEQDELLRADGIIPKEASTLPISWIDQHLHRALRWREMGEERDAAIARAEDAEREHRAALLALDLAQEARDASEAQVAALVPMAKHGRPRCGCAGWYCECGGADEAKAFDAALRDPADAAAARDARLRAEGDLSDEKVRADLEDMGFDSRRIASEGAARIARLLEGQRLMADSFDYLFDEIMEWKRATFPAETQASALAHFMAEASELEACPSDGEEIADCVMLLLSLAAHAGVSLKDEMRAKLEKNRRRKWGEPNADGFQEHVRTLGDEP